jgi:hypothetical protein
MPETWPVAKLAGSVRWQVAESTHELRSASDRILELGASVLGGAEASRFNPPDLVPFCWQVDAANGWRVRGPDGAIVGEFASAADAIRTVEYAAIETLFAADSPVTTLHAALLGREHAGILIVGPGESGKSTLSTALWLAGLAFHGDDVALVAPDGQGLTAAPRRVSLRQPSQRLLGDGLWQRIMATPSFMSTQEGCLFHPHELDGKLRTPRDLEPALILFLARRGLELGAAELRPISPAELLVALAPYSNVVRTAGMGVALERLQPLAARTPAYDLGRGPLPSMLAAIAGLLPYELSLP